MVAVGSGLTLVMTVVVAAVAAVGAAGRGRHRRDGAGLRGDRGQPLVRPAPRHRDRAVLGRQLHRPADLPAGDRPARPGPRLALGGRAGRGVRPAARAGGAAGAARPARATSGERPYGAPASYVEPVVDRDGPGPARVALRTLREVSRRWTFWALFLTFWICGWSTNGLIGTHFIPAAHDHGMPATTSASLLALIGVFDIVGTVASGWLTDRVDPR